MKRNQFEVMLPNDEVIEEQISTLVEKALPKQKTFLEALYEIYHKVPIRQVLFGRGEWLFSLFLWIVLMAFVLTIGEQSMKATEFNSALFIAAPFAFVALTGFFYLDRRFNGTLEIEMTTKFTIYQMLAIRMFIYSIVASFLIITCILVAAQFIDIQIVYSIPIGLSGLFIFASIMLLLYREQHVFIRTAVICAIWIGGNWSLSHWFLDPYESVLLKLPIILYFIILLSVISLFMYALKRFFTRNQGGAFECLK